jgi:hypothetical protein
MIPPIIRRWLERILFGSVALAIILYGGDWAIFDLRHQPIGQVTVNRYLAVPLKGNKTEFDFQGSGPMPCAHALFPQSGISPCWYLTRHTSQFTQL